MSSISATGMKPAPTKVRLGYFEDVTTLPLVLGIEGIVKSAIIRKYAGAEETRDQFLHDNLEVALLPAVDALRLPNLAIIPTTAASAMGASRLLMIFSKKIPTEIQRVLVDSEDFGATHLARLLMAKRMMVRPEFVRSPTPLDPAKYDLTQDDGFDAYLLTGRNNFFVRRDAFPFTMDLTQAWYEYTKLPFVMHVWTMKKNMRILTLDRELGDIARRNETNPDAMVKQGDKLNVSQSSIRSIYERAMITVFDANIIQSLRKYAQELMQNKILPMQPITLYAPTVVRKGING
ncbi:hypothetical protein BH09SUM1_BH09SUM1_30150 [soil metagenome]